MLSVWLAAVLGAANQLRHATAQGADWELEGAGWGYGNQSSWRDIAGTMCGHVGDQSPIDIVDIRTVLGPKSPLVTEQDGRVMRMGNITWSYQWPMVNASLSVTRRGWEARILPPYDSTTTATFFGKEFHLRRFKFASPSENWLEGVGYDMEVQHVHEAADRQQLIISVLLRVGLVPNNTYVEQLWDSFPAPPATGEQSVAREITNPYYGAFPEDRSFYAFNGSLTQPPCKNETIWVVFQNPRLISRAQRDRYRIGTNLTSGSILRYALLDPPPKGVVEPWDAAVGMNNRLTQPLGGRDIVSFAMIPAAEVPAPGIPSDWWAYMFLGLLAVALLAGLAALAVVAGQQGRQSAKFMHGEEGELLERCSSIGSELGDEDPDRSDASGSTARQEREALFPPQPMHAAADRPQGVLPPQSHAQAQAQPVPFQAQSAMPAPIYQQPGHLGSVQAPVYGLRR